MAEAEQDTGPDLVTRRGLQRWRWRVSLVLFAFLLLIFLYAWSSREEIADNIIADQLRQNDIPATYRIERIGVDRQVLADIVIGDPKQPDLTVERAVLEIRYRLGTPQIGTVTLVRPRLFGSYRGGELSFGSLDPLIFTDTGEPPSLPDLDLQLDDARALIETDYGPVGAKLQGRGRLSGGFRGIVAAVAPELALEGCAAEGASLYGRIGVDARTPRFEGPVRLLSLNCAGMELRLADATLQTTLTSNDAFDSLEAEIGIDIGATRAAKVTMARLEGTAKAGLGADGLNSTFSFTGRGLSAPQARLPQLAFDGSLRARDSFNRLELQADLEGEGLQPGAELDAALARQERAAADGLFGQLVGRIRSVLMREGPGSRLAADLTVRKTGDVVTGVVPQANWRGASGASLVALSRFQFSNAGAGSPRFEGNISTGGGLPQITGRMEQQASGNTAFRLRMAEYAAGDARIAIPELYVAQANNGALGFAGRVAASGAFPGGRATNLVLPVSGNWSGVRGLTLWDRCTDIRFDKLEISSLALRGRTLQLCPPRGGAILRYNDDGLQIAAGAPSLALDGELAGTPMTLRSGPVGFAWPGTMAVRSANVVLGPQGSATTIELGDLRAQLGSDIAGTFAGTNARLDAVPLDVSDAAGSWTYAGGILALSDGIFTLTDRQEQARFEPMTAREGELVLEDNVIRAKAELLAPKSGRLVTTAAIVHDLATGTGHADLDVPGLRFDKGLQPDELTYLAEGVIALAEGTVTGKGRIDWNEREVTSSGEFSTDGLDFAAAFGPVQGARGTIHFIDLLGMTTPAGQVLYVDSVNPGIEATDGVVVYKLTGGTLLEVANARLPFLGGTLDMHPVALDFSKSQVRRYVFEMTGVSAAEFVQRMELENLAATGIFDGTLPLVFDEAGNGSIEQGVLISRPPGGNVSYVGELTYEDMGAMANFAFAALRSLDYRQMLVEMNGPLTGEIITNVRFDGVTQGAGTTRNFFTRQIAKLPVRFNVNIRSSFYKLFRDLRSIYDPAMSQDPQFLGLVDENGNPLIPILQPEGTIQTPESEDNP